MDEPICNRCKSTEIFDGVCIHCGNVLEEINFSRVNEVQDEDEQNTNSDEKNSRDSSDKSTIKEPLGEIIEVEDHETSPKITETSNLVDKKNLKLQKVTLEEDSKFNKRLSSKTLSILDNTLCALDEDYLNPLPQSPVQEETAKEKSTKKTAPQQRKEDEEQFSSFKKVKKEHYSKESIKEFVQKLPKTLVVMFVSFLYQLWVYFLFTLNDLKKRKVGYLLGVFSCIMVVFSVAIAQSALNQVSIIFLRLAESEEGEYDLIITPSSITNSSSFNHTKLLGSLKQFPNFEYYSYNSPRIAAGTQKFMKADTCVYGNTTLSPYDVEWIYYSANISDSACASTSSYCPTTYCQEPREGNIIVYDSDSEARANIGRNWKHRKLGPGEAYLGTELSIGLDAKIGDVILVQYNSWNMNGPLREVSIITDDTKSFNFLTYFPVKIVGIIDDPLGKSPGLDSNYMYLEYQHFMGLYGNYSIHQNYTSELNNVDLKQYASQIIFNLPPSRVEKYNKNVYDDIQLMLVSFSSKISYAIGFTQIEPSYPLLKYMYKTRFFRLFVSLIITLIATILSVLSIVLIYSLLMVNVENRKFEYGILRMIGMARLNVVIIITMQATLFSIPGWIIGIIGAQLVYIPIGFILDSYLQVSITKFITWDAFLIASALGLTIPYISSVLPIMDALGQNLHDSLDTGRSKVKAVIYKIERSSDLTINWPVVIVGGMSTIFGGGVYYAFPLALVSFNLSLLLTMFFVLLLAMLLGLIILSLNFEGIIEHFVTYILFFWENNAIRKLIVKNLVAHRLRNRKTSIMFSLSLAFVIFLSIAFKTQIESLQFDQLQDKGARIRIQGGVINNQNLRKTFDLIARETPALSGMAYMTHPITSYVSFAGGNPVISNVGRYKSASTNIHGISPQFQRSSFSSFWKVTNSRNSRYSLSEQLYSAEGSSTAIIGEILKTNLNLKGIDEPFAIKIDQKTEGSLANVTYELFKASSILSSSPYFTTTKFPFDSDDQDILVSLPTFFRLIKERSGYKRIKDIPMRYILVNFQPWATENDIKVFKARVYREVARGVGVKDVQDGLKGLNTAISVIDFFFIFTTVIAMIICFFSLVSSMYTNINEQTKEIGILRAIGVRKLFVWRLYVYEALVLLLASIVSGTLIGLAVGYTLTAQQILFTQYELTFWFPWDVILIVIGLSVVFAFLASIIPIMILTRQPIVVILRKLVT
eukprot:gene3982-7238_t